jgi:hypothetical protein
MRRVSPLPRSLPKNFAAELLFGRSKTSCVLMGRRATPLSICPRSHAPAWERFIGRSASYRQADGEAQPSDAERRGPMFPRGTVGTSLSSPRAKCLTALGEGVRREDRVEADQGKGRVPKALLCDPVRPGSRATLRARSTDRSRRPARVDERPGPADGGTGRVATGPRVASPRAIFSGKLRGNRPGLRMT